MYLYKHKDKLSDVKYNSPSVTMRHLSQQGNEIGRLAARTLFPNGTDISKLAPALRVEKTKRCVRCCETMYEAHFEIENVAVACDILVYDENSKSWDLYEVKSASKAKENYILDAAMQSHVVSKMIPIRNVHLVLIDTSYENKDSNTSLTNLFKVVDITDKIPNLTKDMDQVLKKYKSLLNQNNKDHDVKIGHHCMKPHICEFRDHCWKDLNAKIRDEPNVFDLVNGKKQSWDLYQNHNIVLQSQIPEDYTHLTKKQKIQVDANRRGHDDVCVLDPVRLDEFLLGIEFPVCFFDVETVQMPLPRWPKTRPYEFVPFQYSLHIQHNRDDDDDVEHYEYLHNQVDDPRRAFAESFLEHMSTCTHYKTLLTYNVSFERRVLSKLAERFPDLRLDLESHISRLKDLMIPFQKAWCYASKMEGRHSIKRVLPAFVPDLSYANLSISNGEIACMTYEKMLSDRKLMADPQTRDAMMRYCEMDTFAMVKLLERLNKL